MTKNQTEAGEKETQDCPENIGRDWTIKELDAVMTKAPHTSTLAPDAIRKSRQRQERRRRKNLTVAFKRPPLAMILHKLILDLSFALIVLS